MFFKGFRINSFTTKYIVIIKNELILIFFIEGHC